MNSRERVLITFQHREPDRVPMWCGASPEFMAKAQKYLGTTDNEAVYQRFHDDFRRVFSEYAGPAEFGPSVVHNGVTKIRTPFGIIRDGIGYGQPTGHPLAEATLQQIDDYPWPEPNWLDVSRIKAKAESWKKEYAILGGEWSPLWHDAIDLMGMENLFVRMYEEPEAVEALLGHLTDYYAAASERIFEAAADAIDIFFIGNDFGSQTGPLIGDKLFRQFMFPHLKRLADLGHRYGLYVMMHCCGSFAPLMPAMIEAGIDAVQSLQPYTRGMNPADLKKNFGDRLVFNGCIDSQHVLIEGNPELVREKTRETLEVMMPGGGYIVSPSHDYLLEETPVENVLAMYDTALEYGAYKK